MRPKSKRPLVAVVAVGENGVIGAENALPWHLHTDLQHFKAKTLGKPMIMGRKTFVSIGRPLPGRKTIILTRNQDFKVEGCLIGHSVDEVLALAEAACDEMGADEITVVGGAEVYAALMPYILTIELTRVHCSPAGDAVFPSLGAEWQVAEEVFQPASEKDSADISFIRLVRQS